MQKDKDKPEEESVEEPEPVVEPVKKTKPVPLPEHSKGKYYQDLFAGGK